MEKFKKKKKNKELLVNIKDYLPIGSVVKLKTDHKYLIYGFAQSCGDKPHEQYDYIGVPYPEGNLLDDDQAYFDHVDIVEVCHKGYIDEDYESFIDMMDSMMKI